MKQFNDNHYCFACGKDNPIGLKMDFQYDEESGEAISHHSFEKHFQGWKNVLHGGMISTVLDETMIKAAAFKDYKCATVELNVRFKKPAFMDKSFIIKGKVTEAKKRLITAQSSITDSNGTLVASATGKFIIID